MKKFGAKAKKFAKEADLLVEELKELAKKPKTSYQEANEFVEKAVQFAKKAAKPPDKTLKQFRETARKAVYAWCVQAKTVVAVAKFEDENEKILYEARYKNCAPQKKHAEDFFQEDIENRVLGEKVEENPNGGTITLYLPYQPCNKSTQTGNTVPNQSCCDVLKTIVKRLRKNRRNINLCVKAANTRRLSLTKEKGNNEKLRKNAVDGIKMLMQVKGVNVSGMTPEDTLVPRVFLGKTLVLSGHVTLQKLIAQGGVAKYQITMLENVTVNFKYQEWDFTIHRSKRSLTSILYFCLLLNYKSTVAFYQQSSQETNKSYTLKFEVGYSLTNIFSYQTGQSSTFVYFRFYLFLKYAIYRFVVCKR